MIRSFQFQLKQKIAQKYPEVTQEKKLKQFLEDFQKLLFEILVQWVMFYKIPI